MLPFQPIFAVLREVEVCNVYGAEDPAGGEGEVEELGSLVRLVDLLLEAGSDVEIPDECRPRTPYGAANIAEVDQSCHQQTLLQQQNIFFILNIVLVDQPIL